MSKVYFSKDIAKAAELFEAAGLGQIISPNDFVALKIHFGEPGNTAFLRPGEVEPIAQKIRSLGGKPYFTDCNTLYAGPRQTTAEHLKAAAEHGFNNVSIPAEEDCSTVAVGLKHFKQVYLGNNAIKANAIVALTHFKGHELTGFGGSLKNLGMGFATRRGKLKQHQDCRDCPEIKTCQRNQTIAACWVGKPDVVQEKMVEYTFGAVKDKKRAFLNYLIRVSPNCDCFDHNDEPIVPDIGVLASLDPVAIDQASVDLVNKTQGRIKSGNKFRALYSNVNWETQLKYAEEIGLGSRRYELNSG